jgi:transcription antitermination protein NusB
VAARSKARKRALDILFEADQRSVPVAEVLSATIDRRSNDNQSNLHAYTVEIIDGVTSHADRIDEILSTYSLGWTIDRMPAVDRAALRIGVFELLWVEDVPDGVAIAEAVALVSDHSTDESPAFVNGLLARVAEIKPRLLIEP